MSERARLVCVTGPDGSGKTTQITRLAERLERREGRKVSVVTIWDMLLDPKTQPLVPFEDPAQVDRFLGVLSPTARSLFLFSCLAQALDLARERDPDLLLVNAYWYKYYATEVAHGASRAMLDAVVSVFPKPDLVLYLDVSPEESLRRKARPSRYESGFPKEPSTEGYIRFQTRAHEVLADLKASLSFVELNGAETPDALTDQIVARLTGTAGG